MTTVYTRIMRPTELLNRSKSTMKNSSKKENLCPPDSMTFSTWTPRRLCPKLNLFSCSSTQIIEGSNEEETSWPRCWRLLVNALLDILHRFIKQLSARWEAKSGTRHNEEPEITTGDRSDLSPALWSTLPDDLVHVILQSLFHKLPTQELIHFRMLSKMANAQILSTPREIHPPDGHRKHLFAVLHNRLLLLYDYNTCIWYEKGLTFFPTTELFPSEDLRPYTKLHLITSDGGLLCFSTGVIGQFLLCNPFTGLWRELQFPLRRDEEDALILNRSRVEDTYKFEELLVGLITIHEAGYFELLVATGMSENSLGQSRVPKTMIYNSRTRSWRSAPPVPVTPAVAASLSFTNCCERLSKFSRPVTLKGNVYCLAKYVHVFWDLLKYEVGSGHWSTIPLRRQRQWWHNLQILQYRESILLVEAVSWWVYDFYELKESGPTPWIKVLDNLTALVGPQIKNFGVNARLTCFQCVGLRDFIYLVGENIRGHPPRLKVLLFRSLKGSTQWIFCHPEVEYHSTSSQDHMESSTCFAFEPSLAAVL